MVTMGHRRLPHVTSHTTSAHTCGTDNHYCITS